MDFTVYDPASTPLASLVAAIFGGSAGAGLVPGSVSVHTGLPLDFDTGLASGDPSTIAFYNGGIGQLHIGAGLMLTSGDPTPPTSNTTEFYGVDTGDDVTDADLEKTVHDAFAGAGTINDLTYLQFHINITDPTATGLRFDVVFASDEFPEFANSPYVDVAGVYVNGVNYALFNNNPLTPLSVVQANLDAHNFVTNDGQIPIEYDGVSIPLQVTAPLHMGDNVIKIAIADTGDSIYDSSIFVSGLQAVSYQGFGLSQQVTVDTTEELIDTGGNQTYLGSALRNLIKLISGQDVVDGGAGIDTVDITYFLSNFTWNGSTLGLTGLGGNSSQLINVERVELSAYPGVLVALDTSPGGNAYGVMALFEAALDTTLATALPIPSLMQATDPVSYWISVADNLSGTGGDLGDVAQQILTTYAPGVSNQDLISLIYHNVVGGIADAGTVNSIAALVGTVFPTMGDLFAYAALLPANTHELDVAGFTGSILVLNPAPFGI